MKMCCNCKEIKDLSKFYRRTTASDGYQSSCKQCMRTTYKRCRDNKKDHYNSVQHERYKEIRVKYREWKRLNGCRCCEETEPVCLHLHHLDPREKEYAPGELLSFSWSKIMKEASKCVVVCANCHAKIHAGIISQDKYGDNVLIVAGYTN